VLNLGGIYPPQYFDVVVSFSTLEHIRELQRALDEMDRVTIAGGYLLLGMPAVNRLMEFAFRAIGFKMNYLCLMAGARLVFDGNRTRRFRTASVCVNDAI